MARVEQHMQHIKNFIDKVSSTNSTIVLSNTEAKQLRDEIAILLADLYTVKQPTEPTNVVLKGSKW